MKFRWLTDITAEEGLRVLDLANTVLQTRKAAIGFPAPLGREAGGRLIASWRDDLRAGRRHLLLGEDKYGTVTAAVFLTQDLQPNCQHRAELTKAMIRPEARGLATLLAGCRQVVAKAEQLGVELLTLDVRTNTRAEGAFAPTRLP